MAKVTSTRIAAIKGHFKHAEVITEDNLSDLVDAIAEAAQEHEHTVDGGPGSGTGNAGPVLRFTAFLTPERAALQQLDPAERVEVATPFWSWYELRYDDTTIEFASWVICFPAWYVGGDLKVTVFWKAAATSGSVRWALLHIDRAPGEEWEASETEMQEVTDTARGTAEYLNSCHVIWTIVPDPGDVVSVGLKRSTQHEEDTMSGDAKVLGVLIEEQ